MTDPFNPLDMHNLGESIATAMLSSDPTPMTDLMDFSGAGVYAIYYTGDFLPYELLRQANEDGQFGVPIYVGKAVPAGTRRGMVDPAGSIDPVTGFVRATGRTLSRRLFEHRASIQAAQNLRLEDFYCRWLVTEPIWIPLGESLMIARFSPVWNQLVDGFGNHDPGAGRLAGRVSRWDVLHPGRVWADRFASRNETADDIARDVSEFLRVRLQV